MDISAGAPYTPAGAPCPVPRDTGEVMTMRRAPPSHASRLCRVIVPVLLGLLLLPQAAPAHQPSDLRLSFEEPTRVLSVTIDHAVADPGTHYVKRVSVTSGGATVSTRTYSSQPASSPFTYTYTLGPDVKGEIQVVAECSISGSLSRSITVPEGTPAVPPAAGPGEATLAATPPRPPARPGDSGATPPGTAPATTEAAAGLLPLAGALALAGWRFRR
jgi:hypothetical protein